MLTQEVPKMPWAIIAADLAECKNTIYLIVQEYYYGFPEVYKVHRKSSKQIIDALKRFVRTMQYNSVTWNSKSLRPSMESIGTAAVQSAHNQTDWLKMPQN